VTGNGARVNHISVVAHDVDESAAFYRELFGAVDLPAPNFGFPVRWLELGGLQLHLFQRDEPAPVYGHFAIEVDDVVPVVEEARRHGLLEPTTFGYPGAVLPGGESQVYLRDPAGNVVEVNDRNGPAARARLPEMIVLAERLPQPVAPVPRLSLRGTE
jgi:catechol 2,3-dioxygenase-like lactoylglutathione lyase family enzyme